MDDNENASRQASDELLKLVLELQAEVLKLKAAFERPPLAWGPEELVWDIPR
jgi:hypothetical protein